MEEKLKSVFPNVMFSSLSKVLEHSTDIEVKSETHEGENRDKKKSEKISSLPVIAFDRINNSFNFDFQANDPMTRRGRKVIREDESVREKVLPVNIHYQIDIVSDRRVEVDGIWRELVMYLATHNEICVHYDYGEGDIPEKYPIRLMDTDNTTDVSEFSNIGRVYRQTISIEIPQAKLIFIEPVYLIKDFPVRVINL